MENTDEILYMGLFVLATGIFQIYNKKIKAKRKRNKKLWSRKWLVRRNEGLGLSNLVLNELKMEDPCGFKNFTRMTVSTFEELMTTVGPYLTKQNTVLRECISAETRLLIALRFLATGETYQNLSYSFRVSVPALSLLIPETIEVLYRGLKKQYLTTPTTTEAWKKIAYGFEKLWNFPFCLGALDGKHIAFRAKKSDGSFYFNYKGFHSIVLMALTDAEYNFIYVDVGCNGRISDGGVYRNSSLSTAIEGNLLNFPEDEFLPNTQIKVPYVIVADDAFKASKRILKPWGQRSSTKQKIFNYRLSRARRVVENAFGILANRFQILQKEINLSVEKVEAITLVCCTLHNFIKCKDGKNYLNGIDVENMSSADITRGDWRNSVYMTNLERSKANRSSDEAITVRNLFTDYFNEIGSVPWQENAVKKFNF